MIFNKQKKVNIRFIGTGNAFSEGGRFTAGFWLTVDNARPMHTLVDCGPTTLAGIKKLNLPFSQLNRIILTHYHGDHFAGLPFLLLDRAFLTPFEEGYSSNNKFEIIGPPELQDRISKLLNATYPSQTETLLKLCEFKPIDHNTQIIFPEYQLNSIRANHSEQATMYKFIFPNNDCSFVYTGDNEMFLDQLPFFENIDALITECTTLESQSGNHTSFKFIKDNLSKFEALNVKKIILVHVGSEVFNHLSTNVPDRILLANDGLSLSF